MIFKTESCYVTQAGLKLVILLPPPPKCWDCRHGLPYLARLVFNYIFQARHPTCSA
jgi:hypothetical protein